MNEKVSPDRPFFDALLDHATQEQGIFAAARADGGRLRDRSEQSADAKTDDRPRLTVVFPDDEDDRERENRGEIQPAGQAMLASGVPVPAGPQQPDAGRMDDQDEASIALAESQARARAAHRTACDTAAEDDVFEDGLLWSLERSAGELDAERMHRPDTSAASLAPESSSGTHSEQDEHLYCGDHSAVEEIALSNPLSSESLEIAAAAVFGADINETVPAASIGVSRASAEARDADETQGSFESGDPSPKRERRIDGSSAVVMASEAAPGASACGADRGPEWAGGSDGVYGWERSDPKSTDSAEPELVPAPAETSSAGGSASLTKPAHTPARIGSGRLVPARLTWKPGDPFAGMQTGARNRFRWDVMLTTACVTAICGLAGLWLLRAVLA